MPEPIKPESKSEPKKEIINPQVNEDSGLISYDGGEPMKIGPTLREQTSPPKQK
jgi:hypothetical protein